MKKRALLITLGLAAVLSAGTVSAAEAVGSVYSTDILAKVDGEAIPSYALDGKTAIALRDLENYGFSVAYYDSIRAAYITTGRADGELHPIEGVERGRVGRVVGKVYESDIKAYVNGYEIPSYNIGGALVAAIEDIAEPDDGSEFAEIGYSKTALASRWDGESRTIELLTMPKDNSYDAAQYAAKNYLSVVVDGDSVTLEPRPFAAYSASAGGAIGDHKFTRLYYTMPDGTREEIGMAYTDYSVSLDEEPRGDVYEVVGARFEEDPWPAFVFDLDKLCALTAAYPGEPASVEEETEFWRNGGTGLWDVLAELDTDKYTLLYMRQTGLPHGGMSEQVLRLDKEPRTTATVSKEWMYAPELYGDTLMYFSGDGLYKQNVYSDTAERVSAATDENIDSYLKEHWNVLYTGSDEYGSGRTYVLEKDGNYRIYFINTLGISVPHRGAIKEAYALDGAVAFTADGSEWSVTTSYGYAENESDENKSRIESIKTGGEKII